MFRVIASIITWMFVLVALPNSANASSYLVSGRLADAANLLSLSQYGHVFGARTHRVENHPEVEKTCLALAIYHEARGEPVVGQFAVGMTVFNRMRSSAYPNTVCGVVYQNASRLNRCQFSFACDNHSEVPGNQQAYQHARNIADLVQRCGPILKSNRLGGSFYSILSVITHYHRFDIEPVWSKKLNRLEGIGDHVFFKSERVVKRYRAVQTSKNTASGNFSTQELICKLHFRHNLEV